MEDYSMEMENDKTIGARRVNTLFFCVKIRQQYSTEQDKILNLPWMGQLDIKYTLSYHLNLQ